jgi:putative nucleotidyltransferase with HDIG domain
MKCPGQDSRYWTKDAIFEVECSQCGEALEFYKDEPTRKCRNCGQRMVNPRMDFCCAAYCKFADQCLGDLPPELLARRDELLKDRVAVEMKRYFGRDFRRIGHATKVARYAEELVKEEKGDPAVVITAAYLHDIGIHEAERRSADHEETGPPIAREILEQLNAKPELIDEVCDIIAHHHHPRPEESVNFMALYDADLIVNLEEDWKRRGDNDADGLRKVIEKRSLSDSGGRLAVRVLLRD